MVYCAKQVITVLIFPPFTGHDEIAHYEYVRVLSGEGRPPSLLTHKLPPDLFQHQRFALQWRELGRDKAPLYTALHPPLYYAAMVPFYRASRGLEASTRQYILRLGAIPFGIVTVLLAYRLARLLFPDDSLVMVGTPTLIAFQPQLSYEAAMVNNDICAVAIYSWLIYLLVRSVRDGVSNARAAQIGLVLGIGLLAKSNALTGVPLAAAVIWFSRSAEPYNLRLRKAAVAAAVAAAVSAPWYAFLYRTYGNFSGLEQLASLQTGLTRDDATIIQFLVSGDFAVGRWAETWGDFGWKLIPLDGWVLAILALGGVAAAVGLLAAGLVAWRLGDGWPQALPISGWRAGAILLLAATCVVSYAAVAQFGTRFVLTQARYFFPASNAAALLVMLGLRAWIPRRWYPDAQVLLVLGLFALNLLIFTSYVVPFWHFRG